MNSRYHPKISFLDQDFRSVVDESWRQSTDPTVVIFPDMNRQAWVGIDPQTGFYIWCCTAPDTTEYRDLPQNWCFV